MLFLVLGWMCFPKMGHEVRGRYWTCVVLLLVGAAGSWIQWRVPGTAWFSLTVLPSAVLAVGWRFALGLNLLGSLVSAAFFEIGNAFVANLILNSLLIAFVAITYPGYAKRLPPKLKLLARGLSCWIAIAACCLLASFAIPFFGLALWGIFGRGISISGLWSGLIIAAFTVLVTYSLERVRRV